MEGLEIFDKDGNALQISDVIGHLFTKLETKYPKYDRITIQSLEKIYAVGHTDLPYEPDIETELCEINDI
jgi:hypothetical protein